MRKILISLALLASINPATAQNYQATQGSGTTFGAKSVSSVLYPQIVFCDPATPSQCVGVNSSGQMTIANTSFAVTNAGTFATQSTLAAETTKVIGTVNQGTSPWVISGAVTNAGTFAVQLTGATNNINNIAGTVSLPTGAATSANQTNASQKTQIVDGSGNVIASTSNNLNVQCANCSGSGASAVDEATFSPGGTTVLAPGGGFYQTTATNNPLTNLQTGMWQLTANRAGFINLRNASGAELGVAAAPLQVSLANTAANGTAMLVTGTGGTFPVTGTFYQTTQPVSIASAQIASGAIASGAYASGSIGSGAMVDLGAIADAASTAGGTGSVNAKLRLMTTQLGTLNTTLGSPFQAGGSIANTSFAVTQGTAANLNATVVGTGTFATQATLQASATTAIGKVDPNTIGSWGLAASTQNGTTPTNGGLVMGQFNTTPTTISTGNISPLQMDNAGNLLVNIKAGAGSGGTAIADNAAFTQGSTNETPMGCYFLNGTYSPITAGHVGVVSCTNVGSVHTTVDNTNANGSATSANSSPVVIASDQGAVAIKAASASIASGAIASGAVASGAFASGSISSGAIASGAIAAGAQVDLLTMRGTVAAGTAAANSILAGGVYNSTLPSPTNGQQTASQLDNQGRVIHAPPSLLSSTLVKGTTAAMTGTSSTLVVTAVSSQRIYVMSMHCTNSSATATLVSIQDGSGGTTLDTLICPAGGGETRSGGGFPMVWTTAGNGLYAANVTTSASVIVTASGFSSAN